MRLVVNIHQLANGGVGVLLRGGQRLVAKKLLNGAEVGAIGEEMRGEGMAQGVRVKVPIDIDQTNVFLDDTADRALGKTAAGIVEEHGFRVGRGAKAAAAPRGLKAGRVAERA